MRGRARVGAANWPVVKRVIWAFALLALGDSGHVGFRVVAYALIGFYLSLPWIKVNGYPAIFLDVAERRFHLLHIAPHYLPSGRSSRCGRP